MNSETLNTLKNYILCIITASSIVYTVTSHLEITPLEKENSKLKEQIANTESNIKTTKEYQELYMQYAEKNAKVDTLNAELIEKRNLIEKYSELNRQLDSCQEAIKSSSPTSNLIELNKELESEKLKLSEYKKAYTNLVDEYKKLQARFHIRQDIDELKSNKEDIISILDCMTHGCGQSKYDKKYDPVSYAQYQSQLIEIDKEIQQLYSQINICSQ